MVGSAVAGIAISAITTGMAIKAKKDAKEAAENMVEPTISNPYASLSLNTVGGNFMGEQSQRTMATQSAAVSQAGGRGMAYLPGIARQDALTSQQIAANYAEQGQYNQRLQGQGEQYRQQAERQQYNIEQAGYGQQYAAENQNMWTGIDSGLGILGSAMMPGGAFTGLGGGAGQTTPGAYANTFNSSSVPSFGSQTQPQQSVGQFGGNTLPGYQSFLNN